MRIVIDLQFCQNAPIESTYETLALVHQLVQQAGERELWIAFSNQFPDRLDLLRGMFADKVPAERLTVYDTPAPDGTERVQHTIELIRDNFFQALGADIVFAPQLFARAADTVGGVGQGGNVLRVVSVAAFELPDTGGEQVATHHGGSHGVQTNLKHADLLLATNPHVATRLRAELGSGAPHVLEIGTDAEAARIAWEAFDALVARRPALLPHESRPRLAYVSPLPPQQTGIADYSAELVEQLARYYTIDLIVDDPRAGITLSQRFPVRTVSWFETNAHAFDRIIYHIGNSDAHRHMFDLLQRHPGIVVLHDFFVSNVIDNMELYGKVPAALTRALYRSHGYSGLLEYQRNGRNAAVWKFPANKDVLDNAIGVVVHSEFSRQLARHWYGPRSAANWRVLPLLRGLADDMPGGRERARGTLGIPDDVFLICSFGMLGSTKLNDRLLDAFLALPAAQRASSRLVFVGENDPSEYGIALKERIDASGAAISVSGFVDAATYRLYLDAVDVAVQLRTNTRGETSASVLDCLLHGAATIVNAHGANAILPDQILVKLPDAFTNEELGAALAHLYIDRDMRAALSDKARTYVRTYHSPERVGRLFFDAIEAFTTRSATAHYGRLLQNLVAIDAPSDPRHHELVAAAKAIAANQPPSVSRQLFVDISAVVTSDLKTGIQRVVRSILLALIKDPPPGFRIEPVYSNGGNRRYRYARRFMLAMIGQTGIDAEDDPIEQQAGDVFLGLDLSAGSTVQNQALLSAMRHYGIAVYFVVYDVLPLLQPNAFPYGTEKHFREYIQTISHIADGLVCISRAVADELSEWVEAHCAPRYTPLKIAHFHLGADLDASAPSFGMPDDAPLVLESMQARPSILMVGTVEPRKGHVQALAAFNMLWNQGIEVNLVIVGKQGWMVDSLVNELRNHPRAGVNLFWLPGVSDEMLTEVYRYASALLAASVGEGFGLPLIEAAQHKLSIIARDLPVFREVSGEHAYYFQGTEPELLAEALQNWLVLHGQGQAPGSAAMPWLSWSDSAVQLLDSVVHNRWYRRIPE
jgi:glycosyltransferase involved in cell wall biosynthesis